MADTLDFLNLKSSEVVVPETKGAMHYDGWNNVLSGMGTSRDKRRYTSFSASTLLDSAFLTNMYMGDGLVARIVDTFADDMTREWGYAKNDPMIKKTGRGVIEAGLDKLDAQTYINQCVKWERLFGGALLYIGAMDGNEPSSPLNLEGIKSIEYLKVIDLPNILTYDCVFNEDLKSPNFGKIDLYAVQISVNNIWQKVYLHSSRCIPFFGRKVPESAKSISDDQKYWGISEVQPIWEYLRDFTSAFGAVSDILLEFIIGKYKFSDLDEILSKGNEDRLKTRVKAMDMTKSVLHSVLLGTDEEYTRDSATVTGIADLLDRFMMNLSAVTQYPVTKLFGRSPAGMNATGENDLKNYYDAVRSQQKSNTRYIQNLINMVASMNNLKGEYPWIWNPLFQLNEEQQANVARIEAETSRTLADADQRMIVEGVLLPEEVYKMRFEDALGPKDFEAIEQADLEKELEIAKSMQTAIPEGKEKGSGNELPSSKGTDKKLQKNAK
jgi:phage-related protein (TIGR01555 family)